MDPTFALKANSTTSRLRFPAHPVVGMAGTSFKHEHLAAILSAGRIAFKVIETREGPRLVSVMRQFEMLQRAVRLGEEMNKGAITEVAKVI